MIKTKWYQAKPYPVSYCLITQRSEWKRQMNILGMPEEEFQKTLGQCWGFQNETTGGIIVIVSINAEMFQREKEFLRDYQFDGTLLHECVHAADQVFSLCGQENPDLRSELRAYMVENIFMDLKKEAVRQGMYK